MPAREISDLLNQLTSFNTRKSYHVVRSRAHTRSTQTVFRMTRVWFYFHRMNGLSHTCTATVNGRHSPTRSKVLARQTRQSSPESMKQELEEKNTTASFCAVKNECSQAECHFLSRRLFLLLPLFASGARRRPRKFSPQNFAHIFIITNTYASLMGFFSSTIIPQPPLPTIAIHLSTSPDFVFRLGDIVAGTISFIPIAHIAPRALEVSLLGSRSYGIARSGSTATATHKRHGTGIGETMHRYSVLP